VRKLTLPTNLRADQVNALIPRAAVSIESVASQVQNLLDEVKTGSLAALSDHAQRFDGVIPESFRVPKTAIFSALEQLAPSLREAIEESIARVRKVSLATMPLDARVELSPGAVVSQVFLPVDSVGLYVPGGKAVYPSSVIMNAVPAQVAKVPRIAVCSPAQKDNFGLPNPTILATCAILGIEEVYAIGGATAVAALAYGISEIELEPVRMVTGPGNIFVAAAKRALRGVIGIDSEAGPTEILIVADSSARADFIAADLISQAEHDENAAAVLVTDSPELIVAVEQEIERQVPLALNRERIEISLAGEQSALVLAQSMDQAIFVANEYATEHLEIHALNADQLSAQITNAGAVFIGEYSPVSLGDYMAGSNHVLPTSEQAKFGPGLGVHTFLRPQQRIQYSKAGLQEIADLVDRFASAEGLGAHGTAAKIRFDH
jgi:histidinol dehydrogenase